MKLISKPKYIGEKVIEMILLISAVISILSLVIIAVYIFAKGAPAFFEVGIPRFIFGSNWEPLNKDFGIAPMIVASILATLGSLIIGTFIGILTAVFLAELAPKWMVRIVRPAIQLLAGIPSVVFGFFGVVVVVPMIIKYLDPGGAGNSLLAVIIILSIMILPTIVSISETAINSVPDSYKQGSLALGATHIQTIFKVILPAAKSGIYASIALGAGRAIGETMAVILVAGNTALFPQAITDSVRTLTANIAMEMGYASGIHQDALFATGVVLFVFIMILNLAINILQRGRREKA